MFSPKIKSKTAKKLIAHFLSKNLLSGLIVLLAAYALPVSAQRTGETVGKSHWGPDDEIGSLNLMTDASRLAVLSKIASGKVYDLSTEYPWVREKRVPPTLMEPGRSYTSRRFGGSGCPGATGRATRRHYYPLFGPTRGYHG